MANLKPPYSVWYPAMSSCSASGRSKGARLVSASPAMRNRRKATGWVTPNHRWAGARTMSTRLRDIVRAQARRWFVVTQPVAFLLFLIAGLAETNRAPFDLPEAEQELIAGYQTEYGGFKFAMFYLGEYVGVITMGALVATLFLGGWQGPWLPPVLWFFLKVFAVVFFFIWVRATLPRLRYDQLMALGWKVLIPVGLVNLAVTALAVVAQGRGT